MRIEHLPARIALVINGLLMMVSYPRLMLMEKVPSWIWDTPARNMPMEYMLVAVYVTLGAFLVWSARDPVKALSLIDFTIVSGAIHATTMWWSAVHAPGQMHHMTVEGDVFGTYIAPVTLALTHPRRLYLFPAKSI